MDDPKKDRKEETKVEKPRAFEPPAASKRPVEDHLAEAKLEPPIAAALMRFKRWGAGKLLTDQEFNAARAEMLRKPVSEV